MRGGGANLFALLQGGGGSDEEGGSSGAESPGSTDSGSEGEGGSAGAATPRPAVVLAREEVPKSNKRKGKRRKGGKKGSKGPGQVPGGEEEDIDKLLQELGTRICSPSGAPAGRSLPDTTVPGAGPLLGADVRRLRAADELRKIFGAGVLRAERAARAPRGWGPPGGARGRGPTGGARCLRPGRLVMPQEHWPPVNSGLSMECTDTSGGFSHFSYRQSAAFRDVNLQVEALGAMHDPNALMEILAHNPWHVELLLAAAAVSRHFGEHAQASDFLERALYALEMAWPPSFNPSSGTCCLSYEEDANRPLHDALFQHIAGLSRRGCHRTALECAKLLLALDRSDPKGALFCVDYLALRADEPAFLLRLVEEWPEGGLEMLPNFAFSASLAHFHAARAPGLTAADSAREMDLADEALVRAIVLHPFSLKQLLARLQEQGVARGLNWQALLTEPLLAQASGGGSSSLEHLTALFVERQHLVWKVPDVLEWAQTCAARAIELVKTGGAVMGLGCPEWDAIRADVFPPSGVNEYRNLHLPDFSDTLQQLPPDEMMEAPQPVLPPGPAGAGPAQPILGNRVALGEEELRGANPVVALLQSMMPWVDVAPGAGPPPDDAAAGPGAD